MKKRVLILILIALLGLLGYLVLDITRTLTSPQKAPETTQTTSTRPTSPATNSEVSGPENEQRAPYEDVPKPAPVATALREAVLIANSVDDKSISTFTAARVTHPLRVSASQTSRKCATTEQAINHSYVLGLWTVTTSCWRLTGKQLPDGTILWVSIT